MKREEKSQADRRRNRFFIVLPILIIPFLTMAFWAMGGGKGEEIGEPNSTTGLKTVLPDATLKEEKDVSKMGYYDRADRDIGMVRNSESQQGYLSFRDWAPKDTAPGRPYHPYPGAVLENGGEQEKKVYEKLSQINAQLSGPPGKHNSKKESAIKETIIGTGQLFNQNQSTNQAYIDNEDPEMARIDAVMEKILDIQHPERVKAKLAGEKTPTSEQQGSLSKWNGMGSVGRLDTAASQTRSSGFYNLYTLPITNRENAIRAVVAESRTLLNGSVIKLRLLDAARLGDLLIPKDHFIYGTVTISNERLNIVIPGIVLGASVYPVKLKAYDADGLEGLFIPGAITREAVNTEMDKAAQLLDVTSFDPSLKTKLATVSLDAAKSLFSKKVKRIKVHVREGYQVLLQE